MSNNPPLIIRHLGMQDYQPTWEAMQQFTDSRNEQTNDELWLLEHPPVFTLGRNGKAEHLLDLGSIPLVEIERGGQVTYHGPGQTIIYLLLDIRRLGIGVRQLVTLIEESVVALLADYEIAAYPKSDAPGVYVSHNGSEAKIAALGLRIRRGCSFHGMSLNLDMDLSPFSRINPCGYRGLTVTQLSELASPVDSESVNRKLVQHLIQRLGYNSFQDTFGRKPSRTEKRAEMGTEKSTNMSTHKG